jgi:hypothetical protein
MKSYKELHIHQTFVQLYDHNRGSVFRYNSDSFIFKFFIYNL